MRRAADPLTGLYNRAHLAERLLQLSEEYPRDGREFLVCILDLDHFKSINDTYGHTAGDMVLNSAVVAAERRDGPCVLARIRVVSE